MDCAGFQRRLPEFMEAGGNPDESRHLESCAVCSDLVQDLRYIAEAAKLLVPMEEPSPKVWHGIQNSLRREGLLRPAGGPERLEPFLISGAGRSHFYRWAGATVAVLMDSASAVRKGPPDAVRMIRRTSSRRLPLMA